MLNVEHFETYGWESAIRGVRNPMNSWSKSDSKFNTECFIGPNDLDLMMRLRRGGSDDRKYLRQIFVSCDIIAPLYWWKEMDQYKVSTTTNSCSTMHKIASKEFSLNDFSHEHLTEQSRLILENIIIEHLNECQQAYINVKKEFGMSDDDFAECKKNIWWQIIQILPSSYNQKRTWTANYEVLVNIYHARKNHKLDEWQIFCKEIEKLPYAEELIIGE